MSSTTMPLARAFPAPTLRRTPVLRRCACGGKAPRGGECEECRARRLGVRRSATRGAPGLAPPLVHEVLRSPGKPLDPATRAYMEPRFGHSFADVRIHADGRAAESAAAVHAQAYTAGRDLVFGAGRYAPGSAAGRRLIAHELAHVVQQSAGGSAAPMASLEVGAVDAPEERQAEAAAQRVMEGAGVAQVARWVAGRSTEGLHRVRRSYAGPTDPHQGHTPGAMETPTFRVIPPGAPTAPPARPAGPAPPFKITLHDCAVAPFDEALVRTAARAAFDKVLTSDCIKSESLRNAILRQFDDLKIDCEQRKDDKEVCGLAIPYLSETINIFPKAMTAICGPLESTILHEVIHLTQWVPGEGEPAGCEKSCFNFSMGDPEQCK